MRFYKIKNGEGDYTAYDTGLLYQELTALLGPAEGKWNLLNTDAGTQLFFDVIALDPSVNLDGVLAVVKAHGAKTKEEREEEKRVQEENRLIDLKLLELDQKSIRALVELQVGTPEEKAIAGVKLKEYYTQKTEERAKKK